MKKIAVLFSVLFLSSAAFAKTIEVKMLNMGKDGAMVFEPGFIKAEKGDTVKFLPTDKSHASKSLLTPTGGQSWIGKVDEAISVKMTGEGVYIVSCDPHAAMGMLAVIQVGKPTNLKDAQAYDKKYSPTLIMNKDRLGKYLAQVK